MPPTALLYFIDQTCAVPLPGPIGHQRRAQRPPAARGRPPGGPGGTGAPRASPWRNPTAAKL